MQTADFTIADVLAWARTKPADEEYPYLSAGSCAIAQFGKATGRPQCIDLYDPDKEYGLGINDALFSGKCTFGALVERLEALCPETPVNESNWQAIDAYLTDIEDVARERCSA